MPKMTRILLLVDYENVPKVDLSVLDEGHRAVIFVGHHQEPPKAARKPAAAHRFNRVDFQKIEGVGKNALDFHIAFHLGRVFETAPDTECIVIAKDKGYDPLLAHLNMNGMKCRRVESWEALVAGRPAVRKVPAPAPTLATSIDPEPTVCPRCRKVSTIEHHGGRWCSNCGRFAVAPDPELLPSANMPWPARAEANYEAVDDYQMCGWCNQLADMSDGIYDDGEWMCGGCTARLAT
jgi:hypothetical protein